MNTCCCTGHRPKGFPYQYGVDLKKHNAYLQALLQKIELAIIEYGITHFISGMALGVDLDFAEIVLKLKNKYPVTLECAIPCPNQTLKWSNTDKLRYESILKAAEDRAALLNEKDVEFLKSIGVETDLQTLKAESKKHVFNKSIAK